MSEPIQLIVRFHAKAGCEEQMKNVLRAMIAPTHAEPGEKIYDLFQSADGKTCYFVESWPTAESFEFHKQTPHLKALDAKLNGLTEGPGVLDFVKPVRA